MLRRMARRLTRMGDREDKGGDVVEFDRERRTAEWQRRSEDREPPEPPENGGDDVSDAYLRMLLSQYERRLAELERGRKWQWGAIGAIALVSWVISVVGPERFLAMFGGP